MIDDTCFFEDNENELDVLADLVIAELAQWKEGAHCVHSDDYFNGRRGLSLRARQPLIDAVVFSGADEAEAALYGWRFRPNRATRIITMTKDELEALAEARRTIFNG